MSLTFYYYAAVAVLVVYQLLNEVEAPSEAPVEAPSEAPVEAPSEAPGETPLETPGETPLEAPVETPIAIPGGEKTTDLPFGNNLLLKDLFNKFETFCQMQKKAQEDLKIFQLNTHGSAHSLQYAKKISIAFKKGNLFIIAFTKYLERLRTNPRCISLSEERDISLSIKWLATASELAFIGAEQVFNRIDSTRIISQEIIKSGIFNSIEGLAAIVASYLQDY